MNNRLNLGNANSISIFPQHEIFYIDAILRHTNSARKSSFLIKKWINFVRQNDTRAPELEKPDLFDELQNILHQAGCISRYFFPSGRAIKTKHSARASRLRKALEVKDTSPVARRELRDSIEHFDERLDNYLSRDPVGEFIPMDVDYIRRNHNHTRHVLKGFYINPMTFVLLGEEYEMAPIVNEIIRIDDALKECRRNGYRLSGVDN